MNKNMLFNVAVLVCLLCASVSAQYVTVSYESFDYAVGPLGGNTGGIGWADQWYTGAAVVTSPGFDLVGNKATTNVSDQGSYRTMNTVSWNYPSQIFNNRFGTDGSTMWIKFTTRRIAGGDDHYGGLSLNEQFVGEKIFLGSPWMSGQWGMQDQVSGGPVSTIGGSNIDQVTRFVCRIDFMPGQERVRIWLNPAEEYPYAAAAIDTTVGDFLWNEIRLQSGNGGQGGSATGYDFDDLRIEIKAGELQGDNDVISASGGGTQTLTQSMGGSFPNHNFLIGGSLTGTSPGIPASISVTVPLIFDVYTQFTVDFANVAPFFMNTLGSLDGNGEATSMITLPAGNPPSLAGLQLWHTSVIVDPVTAQIVYATNVVPLLIVP